jgi:hypothetical protein
MPKQPYHPIEDDEYPILIKLLTQTLEEVRALKRYIQEKENPKPFYSPKEFGRLTGMSRNTVVRRIGDKLIKANHLAGSKSLWQIPASELDKYLGINRDK